MRSQLSQRDRDLLQRYLDGQTSAEETRSCESRLESDAEFRAEYQELRRLAELLSSGERVQADPAFWSRLSERLHAKEREDRSLLPFAQKYVPLAASAFALLVLLSFSYVFENRLSFLRFWESQTEAVRSAYEQTVQEAGFVPLFSGVDNDKTLQFALYGSLPLDESGGAMLNVDERSAEGYRIEVQKQAPRKQKKVTVADFVAEVRPTVVQKAAIESLLIEGRRELEEAVLVGQNEAVAINADLNRLNRAMASGIVSVLEPEQRARLKRLLTTEDAAYAYSDRPRAPRVVSSSARELRVPRTTNRFVVLSPETVLIQNLKVDKERIQQYMKESQASFREIQALRERSIRWLVNDPEIKATSESKGVVSPNVHLKTRKDRITIHIAADSIDANVYLYETPTGGVYVQGGDSVARFEFRMEGDFPAPSGVAVAPVPSAKRTVPKPDTGKVRKPFKLDIN